MRTTTTLLSLAFTLVAPALQAQANDVSKFIDADRAAEVALARTAAPKHVSDSATVLFLTPTGYVEVSKGNNGFTCAVIREFAMPYTDPAKWNPRVRAPHCFNAAATASVLLQMLEVSKWVVTGVPHAEVVTRSDRAFRSRIFPMPANGAMAYMLSSRQYLADDHPHWMPHMMFYYERSSHPASRFGGAGMDAPVIDASAGDPQYPITTILIPVRQWSDGTPDAPHAPEGAGR
jgi:hypothetical protein